MAESEHFTYLLGAGASCNSLPIVSEMANRLSYFVENDYRQMKGLSFDGSNVINRITGVVDDPKNNFNDIEKLFLKNLHWLSLECLKNTSIDTYAKKLFHKGDLEKYELLKATLSCYFMLEQARNDLDPRYDNFFASILENKSGKASLPANMNIISWNYDSQLELSYSGFIKNFGELGEDHVLSELQSFPLTSDPENPGEIDDSKFSILAINGKADINLMNLSNGKGLQRALHYMLPLERLDEIQKSELEYLQFNPNQVLLSKPRPMSLEEKIHGVLNFYSEYIRDNRGMSPLLHFAWEDKEEYPQLMKKQLLNVTHKTTTLIVIGYSFPFFNREIDKLYLQNMKNLKRVYIQVPEEDGSACVERIESLIGDKRLYNTRVMNRPHPLGPKIDKDKLIEIKSINDTRQFYLPYEF